MITGASGFIGGAITERLVDRYEIRSLSSRPEKNRFGDRVSTFPYQFDQPAQMAECFRGADVFINTYYVRFNYASASFERAVENTRVLIERARQASVKRIIHVSVSNADEESELPYYRNKGRIERLVRESGLEYVILRPALVFGVGDILINNIAYFLRRAPVFGVFGRGDYRVQPIELPAFGELAAQAAERSVTAPVMNVAGPEDYSYLEMVNLIKRCVQSRAAIACMPTFAALAFAKVAGWVLGDVVLTRDEAEGLMREYLYSENPVRAGKSLASWLNQDNVKALLGKQYASELQRHFT